MADLNLVQLKGTLDVRPGRARVGISAQSDTPGTVDLVIGWLIDGDRKPSQVSARIIDPDEMEFLAGHLTRAAEEARAVAAERVGGEPT